MLNFEDNFVPVLIILHVLIAGMTDFKVFRKDFSVVSPTLPLQGNITKCSFSSVLVVTDFW